MEQAYLQSTIYNQKQFSKTLHQLFKQGYLKSMQEEINNDISGRLWPKRLLLLHKIFKKQYFNRQKLKRYQHIIQQLKQIQSRRHKLCKKKEKNKIKQIQEEMNRLIQELKQEQNNKAQINNKSMSINSSSTNYHNSIRNNNKSMMNSHNTKIDNKPMKDNNKHNVDNQYKKDSIVSMIDYIILQSDKPISSSKKQLKSIIRPITSRSSIKNKEKTNNDDINNQINKLQHQLSSIKTKCLNTINQIQSKIIEQQQSQYLKNNLMVTQQTNTNPNKQDLQCLQYLIKSLQQKQISQSISKIISMERTKAQTLFQITYQKAINIQPKLITQHELNKINKHRQISLNQFYRTGVKSKYSYICHNYVGFRELIHSRLNITNKIKDKCMLQMMKKGSCLTNLIQIQQEMSNFNMCHHCKFLYHENYLFTCKFSSDKQSLPRMNLQSLNDPNLNQSYNNTPFKNRSSQRFMTRKKNCLTSYAKIHDEYVCGRKYCFSCLKDNYQHENIRQNGLCPFCLGICTCTRCLRSQKIAKFKTMYCKLGGDIMKIQQSSQLQQLQVKSQIVSQRGRGRPKKYINNHISINQTQKKLRRFDENGNIGQSVYLSRHKAKKVISMHNGSKKACQSGMDTQEQTDLRKKRKDLGEIKTKKVRRYNLKSRT